jgi:EAL domain-containing protein (putative c-di-GMP-specific phosphodiesterase class I)
VLAAIALRLAGCVRAGDTVARIGGDEFAVVLHQLERPEDARMVAKKILDAMAAPVHEAGQEIYASLSIGIAVCPGDGERPEVLMRNADAALSQAKSAGRNLFQFYTAEMNTRVADQVALERDLRRALERNEFTLQYQPKVDLVGGLIVGFEALLRWNRAGQGPVPPALLVPVLEASGLIREVGGWVVREACRQVRAWIDEGLRPLPVAVNISAKQFHGDLHGLVEAALRESGIEAAMLTVEITESDAMLDPDRAVDVLHKLEALGVKWSIDDFGTGYSSLSYLKRFRPCELKLDRSFVHGLPSDADDVSITNAVISMAHSLGMKVVAEGVETEAQRRFLQSRGCDQMQGYLFSRPLPAASCRDFLLRATQAVAA